MVPTWSACLSKRSLTEWSLEQRSIFDQDVYRRRQQEARRHHGQEDLGVHSGKDEAAEEQVEGATGLWIKGFFNGELETWQVPSNSWT